MEEEAKQFCNNCKKTVGDANFVKHITFCESNLKVCDVCDEPILKYSLYEEHNTEGHTSIKCQMCDISVKIWLQPEHEEICLRRPIICEFCDCTFPFNEYEHHNDFCGSRTEKCSLCPKYIMLKNEKEHNENNEHYLGITDTKLKSENASDILELPSEVTDKQELYFPSNMTNDDPSLYGKWLIFTNGDLKRQDFLWIQLQNLVKSGHLMLLLSSTAKKDESRGPLQGVLMCYTCKDIYKIRSSGIAIQEILNENIIIDYKTNSASQANLYRINGQRFISKFMLTVNGKLYKRDKISRWKQITENEYENFNFEEDCSNNSNANVPSLKRPRLESEVTLPSEETRKTHKKYFYPDKKYLQELSGLWCLFCDVEDIHDEWTELDNAWIKAKALRDEGFFKVIICETKGYKHFSDQDINRRTIMCEISDYDFLYDYAKSDRLTESADKLRERISYNFPMYFKVFCHEKFKPQYKLKYLYTEDREFYEFLETKWKLVKRA